MVPPYSIKVSRASTYSSSHLEIYTKCILITTTTLKIYSKCSFIVYKLRFFVNFCLVVAINLLFCKDLFRKIISNTRLSRSSVWFPNQFFYNYSKLCNWAFPLSLATTCGISFDFFSYGYLDVSVPHVRLIYLCIQYTIFR